MNDILSPVPLGENDASGEYINHRMDTSQNADVAEMQDWLKTQNKEIDPFSEKKPRILQ